MLCIFRKLQGYSSHCLPAGRPFVSMGEPGKKIFSSKYMVLFDEGGACSSPVELLDTGYGEFQKWRPFCPLSFWCSGTVEAVSSWGNMGSASSRGSCLQHSPTPEAMPSFRDGMRFFESTPQTDPGMGLSFQTANVWASSLWHSPTQSGTVLSLLPQGFTIPFRPPAPPPCRVNTPNLQHPPRQLGAELALCHHGNWA